MFPVRLGSVIAATTPIIVRDNSISAIVNAKILHGFNRGCRSAPDMSSAVQSLGSHCGCRSATGSTPFAVNFTSSASTDCLDRTGSAGPPPLHTCLHFVYSSFYPFWLLAFVLLGQFGHNALLPYCLIHYVTFLELSQDCAQNIYGASKSFRRRLTSSNSSKSSVTRFKSIALW